MLLTHSRTFLRAPNLSALRGIDHGFFSNEWGNCAVTQMGPDNSLENRGAVARAMGTKSDRLLTCSQFHSNQVVIAIDPWRIEDRPQADAIVTRQRGLVIAGLSADCIAALFADAKAQVIGVAHAGWRGAQNGVLENTIAAMESIGASRENIHVAFSPCILQQSYEVGPEFPAQFLDSMSDEGALPPLYSDFFKPSLRPDHHMFDLPAYAMARLHKAGITSIAPPPCDTLTDKNYFSHRRSTLRGVPNPGNQISAIVLVP